MPNGCWRPTSNFDRRVWVRHDLHHPADSVLDDPATTTGDPDRVGTGTTNGDPFEPCRLVNLDRRSFAATAWIEQGQSGDVRDKASDGRNELQRAVALCVDDARAAAADHSPGPGPAGVNGIDGDGVPGQLELAVEEVAERLRGASPR